MIEKSRNINQVLHPAPQLILAIENLLVVWNYGWERFL